MVMYAAINGIDCDFDIIKHSPISEYITDFEMVKCVVDNSSVDSFLNIKFAIDTGISQLIEYPVRIHLADRVFLFSNIKKLYIRNLNMNSKYQGTNGTHDLLLIIRVEVYSPSSKLEMSKGTTACTMV